MESPRIPDSKLKAGSIIGIVVSIISILFSAILILVVLLAGSVAGSASSDSKGAITAVLAILIIFLLIGLGLSITILVLSLKVLKGTANSGLVVGILMLVVGLLQLIVFVKPHPALIIIDLLIIGAYVTGGILLIIGKYQEETNQIEQENLSVVNATVEQ